MSASPSAEARVMAAVSAYEARLGRYARRLCGDDGWAADAVQETFLRLCRADWAVVEPKLSVWLFTVCRSRVVDRLRKEGRMERLNDPGATLVDAGSESPARAAERNERDGRLRSAVDGLPAREREAVRLKFEEGMDYRRIGEVIGVSEGHVGVLIHRGLATLRRRLAGDAP